MPTKRLLRTVDLRFFCDDANGEWGLAHADTIDIDTGFSAFWDGMGIFHDVFEHAHEHVHKYFRDDAAMNMGGEVAAMGAMWFYHNCCNVWNRLNPQSFYSPDETVINSTLGDMKDAIQGGYCQYGSELVCDVPKQKPTGDSILEWIIREHYERVRDTKVSGYDKRERDYGRQYKKSVTYSKLARLYRYGYRMAQRLVGKDPGDLDVALADFIKYWNGFTKQNQAADLAMTFRGITFKIYRETGGGISWVAKLNSKDSTIPNKTIRGGCGYDTPRILR